MPTNERIELKRLQKQFWLGVIAEVHPGKWAFTFSFDAERGVLHNRAALGIAPELLEYLRSQGVRAIHALERQTGKLFVTTVDTARDLGVLTLESYVIGPRYHLAQQHWFVTTPDYRRPNWRGWPIVTLYSRPENDPTPGKKLPDYRRKELQPALFGEEALV